MASSTEPALRLVDKDGDNDDETDGDELPERLDIDENQPVLNDGDDQGAGDRPEDGAGATEQAGAADHHGCDAVEQQGFAGLGGAGGEARGIERATEAGAHRRKHVEAQDAALMSMPARRAACTLAPMA